MDHLRKMLKGATVEGAVKIRGRNGKLVNVPLNGTLREVRQRFWRLHRKYHFRKLNVSGVNFKYVEPRIQIRTKTGMMFGHFKGNAGLPAFVVWLRSINTYFN